MKFDNMDDMFDHIRKVTGHKRKVVKEITPTEEEVQEHMALHGYIENAKKSIGLLESKRKLFWAKIELRTGEVSRPMQWNEEKNTIEVTEGARADIVGEIEGEIGRLDLE